MRIAPVLGILVWVGSAVAVLFSSVGALAQLTPPLIQLGLPPPAHTQLIPGPDGTVYLGPIRENAYGAGIHSDAAGRAFQWQPEGWPKMLPEPSLKVQPNQWGTGAHADQWGRSVQPVSPFGFHGGFGE